MKSILFICCVSILSLGVKAQLQVRFDFSNAVKTIEFLKQADPATATIEDMISSAGVKTITKKIRSTDSIARIALYKAAKGIKATGKENDFQYEFIKKQLPEFENFIQLIKRNSNIILDSINALSVYLPANKKDTVTISFLAGGYSAGFTMGDDNIFYVGTHQYKNDLTGIVNTCQHELFHIIQELLYDRHNMMKKLEAAKEEPALYAYYLLQNLFVEGSADYIADIDKMDTASSFIKRQLEHAGVNNYRMTDNIFLIETIVMSAYKNPEKTDADAAYRVLFDWNWNNPGYSTGKMMCKALVKKYGPGAIKKYLASDPVIFVKDYIALTKTNSSEFPHAFSADFEQLVDSLLLKIKAL